MAMVATPTKEMSAALPCAISPAIPSPVSKLSGKHTATAVATISWRTHTHQQEEQVFHQSCSDFRTLIRQQQQDIHKDTVTGLRTIV